MSGFENFEDAGIHVDHRRRKQKVICPRCGHNRKHNKDKSLSVQSDKGVWKCHNCGWKSGLAGSGDRMQQQRVYVKPSWPEKIVHATAEESRQSAQDQQAYNWFADRGISRETLVEAGVSFVDRHILFPYIRGGELINIKHRAKDKKFWMEEDAELIFWQIDKCKDAEQIIITEGEIDTLSYMEAGFSAVISVPNGASSSGNSDMTYLDSALDVFESCDRIILSIDNDEAGAKLEAELARRIGKQKCWRVQYPDGAKDANDVLLMPGEGAEGVRDLIERALPYPISGIILPITLEKDFLNLYDFGADTGYSTGWTIFDKLFTMRRGQLTIVTGTPGSGKSEFVDAMMVQMGMLHNMRFGIYSPEYFPPHRYARKWAQKYIGKPFRDGPTPRMSRDEARDALRWMNDHATIFVPDDPTLDEIMELSDIMVRRDAVDFILLDPWNEVEVDQAENQSKTDWIGECLREFKKLLQRTDTIGVIIAHPYKMQKVDKTTNKYPVVQPYDISDSSNWYNKADSILSIWRDRENAEKPINVHVQKMRWEELGELGVADFMFDKKTTRYVDLEVRMASGQRHVRSTPHYIGPVQQTL